MRKPLGTLAAFGLCASILSGALGTAQAAEKIEIDDTKWVSVGAGLRTSYNSVEDAAASGTDRSNDFDVNNIRLYINAQVHDYLKFTFNTEREASNDIRVLDAIARFELNDSFNVWMGRFLPPSDRSNFSGPYFLGTWDFPIAQGYPAIFAGRDNGAAVWGTFNDGMFKYQAGVFEGASGAGTANTKDNLLYAGRVTVNLWDPEPGYYNASTYFGSKDVLAVGLATMMQSDAAGTAASPGDFSGYSVDGLLEKRLGNGGAVTLEGAYYDYDLDDRTWSADTFGPTQGNGYFALAGYLFPQKIGPGQIQPHVRVESFDPDGGPETDKWNVGLTYVIDGHNARLTGVYGETDPGVGAEQDFFRLGLQVQI